MWGVWCSLIQTLLPKWNECLANNWRSQENRPNIQCNYYEKEQWDSIYEYLNAKFNKCLAKDWRSQENRQRIQCNFDENEEWDYRHRSLIQSADWKCNLIKRRVFTYRMNAMNTAVLYFIVTHTLYCKCRLIIYFKEHIVSNFVKIYFNENLISILLHKMKKKVIPVKMYYCFTI